MNHYLGIAAEILKISVANLNRNPLYEGLRTELSEFDRLVRNSNEEAGLVSRQVIATVIYHWQIQGNL